MHDFENTLTNTEQQHQIQLFPVSTQGTTSSLLSSQAFCTINKMTAMGGGAAALRLH